MRIRIKGEKQNLDLILPTALVFSKATVWLANRLGRKYAADAMKNIPPETLALLCAELRRVKRKYGKWDLVEVEGADGESVLIRL